MKRKGVTTLSKEDATRMKSYLLKTRGYKVRSIKVRDDGNFQLSLREPTESGLDSMTINRIALTDIDEYDKRSK